MKEGLCKWQVLCALKVYLYWFYYCYSCALDLSGNRPILPGLKGGFTLKNSMGWKLQALQALAGGRAAWGQGDRPGTQVPPHTRGEEPAALVGAEQQQNGEPRGNVRTDASQTSSPALPLPPSSSSETSFAPFPVTAHTPRTVTDVTSSEPRHERSLGRALSSLASAGGSPSRGLWAPREIGQLSVRVRLSVGPRRSAPVRNTGQPGWEAPEEGGTRGGWVSV